MCASLRGVKRELFFVGVRQRLRALSVFAERDVDRNRNLPLDVTPCE